MPPLITSRDNPRIRAVRALHERRGRREQGAYLVEGVTLLLDALAAGARPVQVLRDDDRLGPAASVALDRALAAAGLTGVVQPVGPAALAAAAATETPQGVLAVLPLPPPAPLPAPAPGDLVVVADGLADPGNLGTLLRVAAGAGVRALLTTPGTVDVHGPKAVRAGMGAHFRLALVTEVPWPEIARVVGAVLPLIGADGAAATAYDSVDWRRGAALVIGGEAGGLSAAARAAVAGTVAIPLAAGVDSLNAAVAAAVILFEAARQRRAG